MGAAPFNSLKRVLSDSAARTEEDSKAPLSKLEIKARDVKKRLALYDRIRSGGQEGASVHVPGQFGVVALDPCSPTWFSLRAVREYGKDPSAWMDVMQGARQESATLRRQADAAGLQPLPAHALKKLDAAFASMPDLPGG